MVINAGLGLGEGVVSGTVAADQVTVTKGIDPEKELPRTYNTLGLSVMVDIHNPQVFTPKTKNYKNYGH